MRSPSDIAIIVQARLSSERVPNKMIRPFAGTTLLDIALSKLTASLNIPHSNIYVSVFESELKEIAVKYPVNIYHRSRESANSDDSLRLIYEWHDKLPYKYVIKLNACSPLLRIETIDRFYSSFLATSAENLFGVIPLRDYFWSKDGLLLTAWPSEHTIMNTKAAEIVFKAAHVLYASRMDVISKNIFMCDFSASSPLSLFPMNELECFDIDYEWQFQVGQFLYLNQSFNG